MQENWENDRPISITLKKPVILINPTQSFLIVIAGWHSIVVMVLTILITLITIKIGIVMYY